MDDILNLDAVAQADLVRRGEVTPLELVNAAIGRIERINPQINAVIIPLFDKARALARSGAVLQGPLAGVPFLLKDLLCTSGGDPQHDGMRLLRDLKYVAPHDSYLAAKFKAAGLINLAKLTRLNSASPLPPSPRHTALPAIRGISPARREVPAAARRRRLPLAWCQLLMATMVVVRFASRPANAAWSGSRPRAGESLWVPIPATSGMALPSKALSRAVCAILLPCLTRSPAIWLAIRIPLLRNHARFATNWPSRRGHSKLA
jgi:hypothetical protein